MPVSRLPVVYSVLAIIFFLTLQLASRNLHQTLHLRQTVEHVDIPIFEPPAKPQSGPITIAYVVSVTSCKKRELVMDGASVLQHSIYLSSLRAGQSKYDYQMIALVLDPDGKECIDILEYLNYTIHLKTVPFSISNIRGEFRNWANRTGCCGEKEWIKLYAYTLQQYPIVVHLDLDCLVLKPLDKLFNAMLYGERQGIPAMWLNDSSPDWPETIDAFFTRDYGMIGVPGRRKPHQIGVQGGFLVLRPNQTVFDEYIDLILEGNYTETYGWGGRALQYGGYYGAGTIQGLAALFYSHRYPRRAVELNRCYYNNMVDSPYPKKYNTDLFRNVTNKPCLTLQKTCDDCRQTNMDDIYTIHLTNCFKPWKCGVSWSDSPELCLQHHYEWFRMRHLLEATWLGINATPRVVHVKKTFPEKKYLENLSFGYCDRARRYRPIDPNVAPGFREQRLKLDQ